MARMTAVVRVETHHSREEEHVLDGKTHDAIETG
jgi:hypothetical protein